MSLQMRWRRTLYTQDDDDGDHGDNVEKYNWPIVQAWCYDNDNVMMRMMWLKGCVVNPICTKSHKWDFVQLYGIVYVIIVIIIIIFMII